MNSKSGSKVFYKIVLTGIIFFILAYNFYVAKGIIYDAGGDAASFIELGVNLAKNQKYGFLDISIEKLFEDFRYGKVTEKEYNFLAHSTWRPPVWPFLIAGVFLIFGYDLTYLLIFKFLLHLGGTYFFYKILKEIKLKNPLVVMGAVLYVVHPAWQLYSRVFLSEPITLFFITLWLFFLIRYLNHRNGYWPQAVISGVLILSHPYYIFLPFSVWLILFLMKQLKLHLIIFSSFICTIIVSLWIIRNSMVLDTNEIVLTTSSGAVMAKGWNPMVPENHTNTRGDLADETLVLKGYDYQNDQELDEVGNMQLYKDASLHFIKNNPQLIMPIVGKKLLSAFNPFPETSKPGLIEAGRVIFQFCAFLALLYLLVFSENRFFRSLAFGLAVATIGITILTYSGFRFRMPQIVIELLMILFCIEEFLTRKVQSKKFNSKISN